LVVGSILATSPFVPTIQTAFSPTANAAATNGTGIDVTDPVEGGCGRAASCSHWR
jgi:hypothetical protein